MIDLVIGNRVIDLRICTIRAVWIVLAVVDFNHSLNSMSAFLIFRPWSGFKTPFWSKVGDQSTFIATKVSIFFYVYLYDFQNNLISLLLQRWSLVY